MQFLQNPFFRFLFVASILGIAWFGAYEFYLDAEDTLDVYVIKNLVWISGGLLTLMGYSLIDTDPSDLKVQVLGIDGTHGLWIGDNCNGLTLFALFAIFVLAYPGPWKRKLWFVPLGILCIHLFNVIRIISLTLIVYYYPDPDVLDFNHDFTFQTLVYLFVFLFWYLWAEKISGVKLVNPANAATDGS